MERKMWMVGSVYAARDKSSLRGIHEDATMFVLMEEFGGKFTGTALGEVLHFSKFPGVERLPRSRWREGLMA